METDESLVGPLEKYLTGNGFPLEGKVVKSTLRTIQLFEFFAGYQTPATVTQVAYALSYPISSTAALLKSLTRMGYMEYDKKQRRYFPTLRISLLGGWLQEKFFRESNLLGIVQTLADETKESVVVAMQNGIFIQYLIVIDGGDAHRAYARTGSLRSMCRSATGRMILTTKTEKEIKGIVLRQNAIETDPSARVSLSTLLTELENNRREGYAMTRGSVNPGRGVIAMLMRSSSKHTPLAVGIGATVEQLDINKENWLKLMRFHLQQIDVSERPE